MNDYDGKADADHGDCCMDVAMYRIVIKGLQLENAKLHAEVELAQSESRKARKRTAELAAEVERLLEERRWRSTKTEPPSNEQWQVLIYDGRNVDISDKLDGIGWTHEFGTLEWEAVTHWQPLPAPPDAG